MAIFWILFPFFFLLCCFFFFRFNKLSSSSSFLFSIYSVWVRDIFFPVRVPPLKKKRMWNECLLLFFFFFLNHAKEFPHEEKSNLLVVNFLGHLFMAVSVNDVWPWKVKVSVWQRYRKKIKKKTTGCSSSPTHLNLFLLCCFSSFGSSLSSLMRRWFAMCQEPSKALLRTQVGKKKKKKTWRTRRLFFVCFLLFFAREYSCAFPLSLCQNFTLGDTLNVI